MSRGGKSSTCPPSHCLHVHIMGFNHSQGSSPSWKAGWTCFSFFVVSSLLTIVTACWQGWVWYHQWRKCVLRRRQHTQLRLKNTLWVHPPMWQLCGVSVVKIHCIGSKTSGMSFEIRKFKTDFLICIVTHFSEGFCSINCPVQTILCKLQQAEFNWQLRKSAFNRCTLFSGMWVAPMGKLAVRRWLNRYEQTHQKFCTVWDS